MANVSTPTIRFSIPLFEKCAELKIPVLIHIAEPSAFFDPWDYQNERWKELNEFPQRARPPSKYPPFETLMAERNHLFAKHPRTHFIAAHLAFHGNDLERLGKLFDTLPNMYVDIAAVLAELGRQPYSAHDFLVKYQDRVLMGKDIYDVNEYKWYFRALETRDEYFEYYRKRHAFWRIYGFQLPDEVLKKIYYKNALKLVPGIDPRSLPGLGFRSHAAKRNPALIPATCKSFERDRPFAGYFVQNKKSSGSSVRCVFAILLGVLAWPHQMAQSPPKPEVFPVVSVFLRASRQFSIELDRENVKDFDLVGS